jgi:hypothetical protein
MLFVEITKIIDAHKWKFSFTRFRIVNVWIMSIDFCFFSTICRCRHRDIEIYNALLCHKCNKLYATDSSLNKLSFALNLRWRLSSIACRQNFISETLIISMKSSILLVFELVLRFEMRLHLNRFYLSSSLLHNLAICNVYVLSTFEDNRAKQTTNCSFVNCSRSISITFLMSSNKRLTALSTDYCADEEILFFDRRLLLEASSNSFVLSENRKTAFK